MASFTDTIMQFNPYVAQLPVEAMMKVGMYKQQKYEENVGKIQTYIDNIAGLNIIKDQHKQYLQERLNQIGSNLKNLAGADFSNFQIVSSVGGMVSQIAKDPIIQTAVSSTNRIEKSLQEAEEDIKKGAGPQNREKLSTDINSWLKNPDLRQSFSGGYLPYTDVEKKFVDLQKELGVTEIVRQLPFYQDAEGRFIDKQGNLLPAGSKPVLNDVMIEKTFKGKSPQAIKNAILSALNERDYQQLGVNAWYNYRGVSIDALKETATNTKKSYDDKLLTQIRDLKVLKGIEPNNKVYQESVDNQIEDLEKLLISSNDEYNNTLSFIESNPEEYKRRVYLQDKINRFSLSWSNYTDIQKIVDNPYQEKLYKDAQLQLSKDRLALDAYWKKKDYDFSVYKFTEEQKDKENKDGFLVPGPLDIASAKDVVAPTIFAFNTDIANLKSGIDTEKERFRTTILNNMPKAEFDRQYALYEQQYRNGASLRAEWAQFFDSMRQMNDDYESKLSVLKDAEAEVDALPQFAPIKNLKKKTSAELEAEANVLGMTTLPRNQKEMEEMLERRKKARIHGVVPGYASAQLMSERNQMVEQKLSERLTATYTPRSLSFGNLTDKKQYAFIQSAVNQYLTRIEQEGGQESGRVTKGFDLTAAKQLNLESDTKYGIITQGDKVWITMNGLVGKDRTPAATQIISTDASEFERVFRKPIVSANQRAADITNTWGNTNVQSGIKGSALKDSPSAYKTAHYKKLRNSESDRFPMVSKYNVSADIIKLPRGYQALFYIQDPVSKKWIIRESSASDDFDSLIDAFSLVNDATIDNLLK